MNINKQTILNTFSYEQLTWLYRELKEISGLPTYDHIFNELCDFEDIILKRKEEVKSISLKDTLNK